jgi:hypothetical protein
MLNQLFRLLWNVMDQDMFVQLAAGLLSTGLYVVASCSAVIVGLALGGARRARRARA